MSRRRRGGPHGVVVLDKPAGPTSFTVMRSAERRLGAARAGHAGTLDAAASGVLVVLLGEATKLSPWVMSHDKEYLASVELGSQTDTLDARGEVVQRCEVPPRALEPERLREALAGFVGTYGQVPPAYSAIKRGGRSLMQRTLSGEEVDPEPREVTCHALELVRLEASIEAPRLVIRAHCASGFYVRSLARDVARALGVVGHVVELRRLRSGPFRVEAARPPDSVSVEDIVEMVEALPEVPAIPLDAVAAEAIRNGRTVPATVSGERALLLDPAGAPLAMAVRTDADRWRVLRGFRFEGA